MKVKTKVKLIMLMLVIMAAALFAGCTIGPESYEDFIERNAKASITYYGNGGIFGDNSTMKSLYIGYPDPENQPAFEVTSNSTPKVSYSRYVLVHWVFVETDENGQPIFEDEAQTIPKLTDRVVDFETLKLHEGDRLHIAAVWVLDVTLDYVLVCDAPIRVSERVTNEAGETVTQTKTYQSGDVIYSTSYGANSSLTVSDIERVSSEDSTYLEYFLDEDCTRTALGVSFARPEDGVNNRVYAKYIPGVYSVVKTMSHVSRMFTRLNLGESFYIYNDIDCSSLVVPISLRSTIMSSKIEGHGHIISGLKFSQLNIPQGATYSIFGTFGAAAHIEDLKLTNIEINTSIRGANVNIYAVNGSIITGATPQVLDFEIENITLNINGPMPSTASLENIPGNSTSGYTTNHWVFGGADTDSEFAANHTGIIVKNAQLNILGETIVESVSFNVPEPTTLMAKTPYYITKKENI